MPTIKQKKAFVKVVENHGNVSKSMKEVGYQLKVIHKHYVNLRYKANNR